MSKIKKSTRNLLIAALILVLCGSFLASMFNTGMFSVNVSRISFDTANGTLSGLLYMPKDASASNPRPTVILTHGYLNSAEMQDANAIELSRRGYVVFAFDMYDHGHSDIKNEVYEPYAPYGAFLMTWAPFWVNSMNDAVQYIYDQPYVLKDANSNGVIGVTGHSMGGFSSTMAVYDDEQAFAATGVRKIMANLTEGSDFNYSGIFGVTADVFNQSGGGRILGKVAAQYDEFFFNEPDAPAGTVRKKNYVGTPDGKTFLQQENGQANTWYDTSDGGKRIIYQPAQTHPWNHFSKTTTANAIEFYTTAFAAYNNGIKDIAATSQIWQWKEAFECVALVGFILFLLAIAKLLIGLPFFSQANTGALVPQKGASGSRMIIGIVIMIVAILLPGILFETLYGWDTASTGMNIVFWAAVVIAMGGCAYGILQFNSTKEKKYLVGGSFALVAGVLLAVLSKMNLYTAATTWTAPVVNDVGKWTVGCTFIALLIMSLVFLFVKSKDGVKLADYGVTFKPMAIIAGLCTAVVSVVAAYALLFLVDLIFKTDFRIWTFAFKTFDANICPAIIRYLPTFLAFYIVSTASICINTNTERLQGWKGYCVAILLNAGGALIWLIRQYVTLFSTGVAAHPGAALSGIVLVAMVVTLAIAACISRFLYKRTGNIWTAAFTNGLLMTIMTVANTTVFYK
ncbi:MAG: alpha/beta fold hydrolase [Clostridia bacterium]|nr:alpha/beta fold hydrolase [Clostridia bacterium]